MNPAEIFYRFLLYTSEMPVLYRKENDGSLVAFEKQNCFLKQAQPFFQADVLEMILPRMHENRIYEVTDPLGISLFLFLFDGYSFLLGPFVSRSWQDDEAEKTLASLSLPASYFLPYKLYYGGYRLLDEQSAERLVTGAAAALKPDAPPYIRQPLSRLKGEEQPDLFSRELPDFDMALRRYEQENLFLHYIEAGDAAAALEAYRRMEHMGTDRSFSAANLRAVMANATIVRTLARKAAERGGVHPAVVDAISVAYAQKMYAAADVREFAKIIPRMIREFSEAAADSRRQRYTPLIRRTVSYISLNFSQDLSLAGLSENAGVSPAHLSRQFKAETGMTISRFIARTRCEKAAFLLRTTDLAVQDISAHVGYLDNNYFVKVFRGIYGTTPSHYRTRF